MSSVRTDRNFYETVYEEADEAPWSGLSELDRRTLNWLSQYRSEVPNPDRALDLGAGEGRITRLLAEELSFAVGLDVLRDPMREAAADATGTSFVQADAFKPPFSAEQFSVLVDYGLLHHVRKADWDRYRETIESLLVPGAFRFFSVFHESDEHANRTTRKWVYHRGHYDRFFEREDLRACLGTNFEHRESELLHDDDHTFLHVLFRYRPDHHD